MSPKQVADAIRRTLTLYAEPAKPMRGAKVSRATCTDAVRVGDKLVHEPSDAQFVITTNDGSRYQVTVKELK